MAETKKNALDPEELEEQNAEPLPDREAMSVIDPQYGWRLPPIDGAPETLPTEPPEPA
jgi:hypothetical protein